MSDRSRPLPPRPERPVIVDMTASPYAALRPLSLAAARLDDIYWAPRRHINRTVTLPEQYRQLDLTGRLRNFQRAAGQVDAPYAGRFFNDSDVYKWVEAAAWTLATDPDPDLSARVDGVIALIAAAQDADGYLNTYFTFERAAERWTDLAVMHELYCAGHLMQAAVAHHRATGSRALLDVAVRFADHIDSVFGPGKRAGACGHPEIEMALVELARETGEERYLRLAGYFIDQRGQQLPASCGAEYCQDHEPFRAQREVVGHAVRALYLYCGAADVYAETGERSLWDTLDALWRDLEERKVYLTGGVGARYEGEAVGDAYELPNRRAYAETCAAIANVMWNWRLLLLSGEARFADALETALYNGVLSGLALDGAAYFYQNPLADRGGHRREPWFGTACCPPNIARLLASLPGYLYTTSPEGLWVHLYASGSVTATLQDGGEVTVTQRTEYPWDGVVSLEVRPAAPATFTLFLRIPGWAEGVAVTVNGEPAETFVETGGYARIRRPWRPGDTVHLTLPLTVRTLAAHPRVTNDRDRVALRRGPLVYCLEAADHPGVDVWDIVLPARPHWRIEQAPEALGGVTILHADALARTGVPTDGPLYRPFDPQGPEYTPVSVTAIPYYAWANRAPGPMQVWLPVDITR